MNYLALQSYFSFFHISVLTSNVISHLLVLLLPPLDLISHSLVCLVLVDFFVARLSSCLAVFVCLLSFCFFACTLRFLDQFFIFVDVVHVQDIHCWVVRAVIETWSWTCFLALCLCLPHLLPSSFVCLTLLSTLFLFLFTNFFCLLFNLVSSFFHATSFPSWNS